MFRQVWAKQMVACLLLGIGFVNSASAEIWSGTTGILNTVITNNGVFDCTECHSVSNTVAGGLVANSRHGAPITANFDAAPGPGSDLNAYINATTSTLLYAVESVDFAGDTTNNLYEKASVWVGDGTMPYDPTAVDYTAATDLSAAKKTAIRNWALDGAPYAAATANTHSDVQVSNPTLVTGKTTATLKGTVNTNVHSGTTVPGTYYFEYNTVASGNYNLSTSLLNRERSETSSAVVSENVTNLICGTTYQHRAVATNGHGTTTDATPSTFTTDACTAPVIHVSGFANNGPLALNLSKGQLLTNDDFLITATDVDDTSTLDWSISSPATTNGITTPTVAGVAATSSTNTANPAITYTAPDTVPANPLVSFTVQVEDETPGTTLKDTIVINVTIVDNAPTIDEGATLDFPVAEDSIDNELQLIATDIDGDPLTWTTQVLPAGSYTGAVNAGDDTKFDVTYSPVGDADTLDADTFTVRVSDGTGFSEIVVSVDITGSPDDPVANDDPDFEVLVNSSNNILAVLSNDTDVDTGDTKTLAAQVIDGSNGGTITVNSAGSANNTLSYTPVTNAVVVETFNYTITDSFGRTDTALVTVSPFDTDMDGVFDYVDNCAATPNGPLLGSDNQADNDNDQIINVNTTSDPADPLVGGDACDTDDDNDGMSDADELLYPLCLDKDNAADATEDCDGDGIDNATEINDGNPDTVPNADSVGPTVIAPADITVTATGLLTVVDLGKPTGSDGNDGASSIFKAAIDLSADDLIALDTPVTGCEAFTNYETDIEPFRPGTYTVTWATCDSAGNSGRDSQIVNVKPLVGMTAGQSIGEGQTVNVDVVLNGDPIDYSATVNYTLSGTAATSDHDGVDGTVEFTEGGGNIGVISIKTLADVITEGDETIVITLGTPDNIALGTATVHTVTITEANIAPVAVLSVTQPSALLDKRGNVVYTTDGAVKIEAIANDGNEDTLSFDWSATDDRLLRAATITTPKQLDFDPSDTNLVAGDFYNVVVTISDGTSSITVQRLLQVQNAVAVTLDAGVDRDGDGRDDDDPLEGYGDDDADGIPNYADNSSLPANAIENNTIDFNSNFIIETDPGLHIALGETAVAAQATGIQVGLQDIINHGGNGGTAVSNATTDYTFLSTLLSFEISGLSESISSANVVIPLPSAIQADSIYRKYNSSGWFDFVIDDNNVLRTSAGSDGTCPQPGSALYVQGLTIGDLCLQLTIEDGGANDADGERNFIIRDPGGLALAPEPEVVEQPSKANGRVGSVSLWFMLLLSLVAIMLWRIRQQKLLKQKV